MRHSIHVLALALCAGLASAPLYAGTPINETRPLDPRGRIEIDNMKGRIQVRAWDRNEVRVTGTLGDGVEKLVVDGDRGNLEVRVEYPKRMGSWRNDRTGPTDLMLMVPLQASLDIESVSADIDVDGVAPDEIDVDTVSGNVTIAAAPRQASIESVSGDLVLTLNSREAKTESVSGDIVLKGRLDGEVHAETVSGDITIDSRGQRVRRLSTGTVSGDADVRVGLADGGEIKSETVSGEIKLRLPKALSARVSGETFSGDLDAPNAKIHSEDFGPGKTMEASYGNGAGEIRMESFSGDAILVLE
ncbi:MAG TPA: DUF4097 family beta strand repeat-containing protein [Luteimonas sp.]|jgi:DUF4097 and DUF4098 domain-containing protein YvlB|nr:DUF4097 family beta strand repeat-containing protein [Luteimonas sp.]